MSEEWEETSLGECTNWASGGTPSKKNASFWVGDIPWVSAKDMKKFRLFDAQDQISTSAIGRGGKITPKGSILLLVRGMTLHNDVPICVTEREMAFNQDLKAIRPKGRLDGNYLAYWLLAKKPDLLATVDQAGHGTGRLVTDRLKEMRISIPPLSEQKRIAHILGTLDDKIELNRRMNATLEAVARALFQSWFVDGVADGQPKDWVEGSVGDLAEFSRGILSPAKFVEETFAHYSLPAFDVGRIPKQDLGCDIKSNKTLMPINAVLISKLNPRIPRTD